MKALTAFLVLLLLPACTPPEPDYERMRRSTVLVTVETAGISSGHGSGVLTPHGVLTAAHVVTGVNDPSKILVQFKDGEFVRASVKKLRYKLADGNLTTDLALLKIPTSSGYPLAGVLCNPAAVGEPVFVVGNPGVVRWSVTRGIVISDTKRSVDEEPGRWLQTDAAVAGGNSGGPMFGPDGYVRGIVSHSQMQLYSRTGHGFGNSGPVICDFMETET